MTTAQADANLSARVAELEAENLALRASDAEWRQLLETMPQIVWITRPDGWHVHFNHKWMDFTGLTLEESLGHGWNPPFHPEDRPRAAVLWEEATRTGQPYEIEYRLRRADGEYHWMLGRAMPLHDAAGRIVKWFGTCTDIEDLKQAELRIAEQARQLEDQATHDALTGLANRTLLFDRLELLLAQRYRSGVAVAFIDLDGFKEVNDDHGHAAGDALLVQVAGRLRASVRVGDLVARLGGDEFVVVGEADDSAAAVELGRHLAERLRIPVEVGAGAVEVSASIGVAFVGRTEQASAADVLSRADALMYAEKRSAAGGQAASGGMTALVGLHIP